jgi:hypothetical protein
LPLVRRGRHRARSRTRLGPVGKVGIETFLATELGELSLLGALLLP